MTLRSVASAALAAALAAGCGAGGSALAEAQADGTPPGALRVCPSQAAAPDAGACPAVCGDLKAQPAWNAGGAATGGVAAVVEQDDLTALFGDQGATVFLGGVPASADATVTAWKGAAAIPAADGNGTWTVGLAQDGRLSRIDGSGALEPVSDRWGLLADPVSAIAATGGSGAAFALAAQLAVSDGATVRRYDAAASALAGGGGKAAWVEPGLVRRLDPAAGAAVKWPLPDVFAVAIGASGRLIAATPHGLWAESGTVALVQVYRTPGTLRALAASGDRFWFVQDQSLGFLEGTKVQRTQASIAGEGAKLFPSPGGGVWTLAGGAPQRWSAGGQLAVWQQLVLPVFARVCSSCHLPGGTAGIPLATLGDWMARKDAIVQRVLQGVSDKPMPPQNAPAPITDDEKNLIRCWIASVP